MRCRACKTPTVWGYLKTAAITTVVCTGIVLVIWKMNQ
jgi:hypothetical protein